MWEAATTSSRSGTRPVSSAPRPPKRDPRDRSTSQRDDVRTETIPRAIRPRNRLLIGIVPHRLWQRRPQALQLGPGITPGCQLNQIALRMTLEWTGQCSVPPTDSSDVNVLLQGCCFLPLAATANLLLVLLIQVKSGRRLMFPAFSFGTADKTAQAIDETYPSSLRHLGADGVSPCLASELSSFSGVVQMVICPTDGPVVALLGRNGLVCS